MQTLPRFSATRVAHPSIERHDDILLETTSAALDKAIAASFAGPSI